ncbi:glycosyltransferase family 2 protein [Oceaniglobus roseus]|uniref:glycosyltransferase family 2 protein n=1 Tax=Oceaniglobus roseus TaxID=1737570 RepID=UPI000C7F28CB|nr:glycosyltransferase family 2 protein [Kandeliimicrobium roseum]
MSGLDGRGVFLATISLALLAPAWMVVPLVLIAAAQIGLGALNLTACLSRRPTRPASEAKGGQDIFFSVHLAIHDEPPALVARTLRALAGQVGAPGFEVIVLDNNTADVARWQPVEALCRAHGSAFRFYHEDDVKGAKAGALNIALARSHPRATHVVVIDADYEVERDFLAVAASELHRRDDDFLQFPQAYREDTGRAAGISLELADYFLRHARHADVAGAMLLTGTLSVIRRGALERVGGWNGDSVTEDADLGVRLRRSGFTGRFVDRVAGRGILPLDLAGLCLQRYRWASGNLQTALGGLGGLAPRTAFRVFSQLTAWANLALPLAAGLIGGGAALAFGIDPGSAATLTAVCGLGLVGVGLSACLPMILAALLQGRPPTRVLTDALAARVALILPSALGTVDALLGRADSFRRTAKDAADASDRIDPAIPALAAAGLALVVAAPLDWAGITGATLLILPLPLSLATRSGLSAYRAALRPD